MATPKGPFPPVARSASNPFLIRINQVHERPDVVAVSQASLLLALF
jgi:hypothetical protein